MATGRWWAPIVALFLLTACGDGSIRSPGFIGESRVEALHIEPADDLGTPAGTTQQLRAIADLVKTVPPGTPGVDEDGRLRVSEDVTEQAEWRSRDPAIAGVDRGLLSGAQAGDARIEARFQGVSAEAVAVISDAVVEAVAFVKPASEARADDDRYEALEGSERRFEMHADFSDGRTRVLDPARFSIAWSSSDPEVAVNADDAEPARFSALRRGDTQIVGSLQNAPGVNPISAAATLAVEGRSEVCAAEFAAPNALVRSDSSFACVGCSVSQAEAAIDRDDASFATLSIPLGLLFSASVELRATDTTAARLQQGEPAGVLISRDSSLLGLELLSGLELRTASCDVNGENCVVAESFGVDSGLPLKLSLLGLIGGQEVALASTPPLGAASADANALIVSFSGGLLSAGAELNLHTVCAVAP